jgi:peptidyl-prolyl cis-trans isomerase D
VLDQMRKNSRSLLISGLFVIIIVTFIISFGPQSRGTTCEQVTADDHYVARVGGQMVSKNDFNYAWFLEGGDTIPPKAARMRRMRERLMDQLIERELLTSMADKLGFAVSDDEVAEQIGEAKVVAPNGFAETLPMLQKDGQYNYEALKRFVRGRLQTTPNVFFAQQKRELLAARVRDLVRGSVTVSPEEVKSDFIRKNRQLNLEYMRFSARRQESDLAPTADEIAAYAAKNEAKLKELYEQRKGSYDKVPAQRRLRQILVKVAHDADDKADKAAREKANALVEKLKRGAKGSGKDAATFAEVAKQSSDDAASKAKGGDLGWRGHGSTNVLATDESKLFEANVKAGAIIGPLKGNDGYVITKVEGSREGHIPFETAKLELAEEKLREEQGTTRAKAAAEAALAKAKTQPTATLKTVFPPPSDTQEASATDAGAPRVEETGLFALRMTSEGAVIEGIGPSNALAKEALALTADKPLAGPVSIGDNFYVIRLKERKEPDLAEFEKKKLDLTREAEMAKGYRVFADWMKAVCTEAKAAKRISVNLETLKYNDEAAEQPSYEPCADANPFGG